MEQKPDIAAQRRVSIIFAILGTVAIVIPAANAFFIGSLLNPFGHTSEMSLLAYCALLLKSCSLVVGLVVEALALWFAGSIFLAKARYEWAYSVFLEKGGDRKDWPSRLLSGR